MLFVFSLFQMTELYKANKQTKKQNNKQASKKLTIKRTVQLQ